MTYEFKLPDIGEGVHEGEIVQWLVNVGDNVKEDQPIVEIMTDKVTAEIPAPVSGVIQSLHGEPGEVIHVGSVIAVFETKKGAGASTKPAESSKETGVANGNGKATSAIEAPASAISKGHKVLAAPATRRLARELGVDLAIISGSGPRGRVTPTDVRDFETSGGKTAKTPVANLSPVTAPRTGGYVSAGERREKFAGLRRKIAEHLVKSKQIAPHFAYVEEVDMTRLVAVREELLPLAEAQDVKLNYLPFIIKAVIAGLREFPMLNAQLDETRQEIVYQGDFHIGVAVATDDGLIVPVVKHADQKDLLTLSREIRDLADRARNGKLALDDLQGGTFTITSIGSIGGLFGIPIINYPEVAIMGVNKIEKRPVVRQIDGIDQIVIRQMMNLSLSCDHRIVDGAEAARFANVVLEQLQNPSRLVFNQV